MKQKAVEESKQKQEYGKINHMQMKVMTRPKAFKMLNKDKKRLKSNLIPERIQSHTPHRTAKQTMDIHTRNSHTNRPEKILQSTKKLLRCEHNMSQIVHPVTQDILIEILVIRKINYKENPDVIFQDPNLVTNKLLYINIYRREIGGITTIPNLKLDIIITEPATRTTVHQHDTTPPYQLVSNRGTGYRLTFATQNQASRNNAPFKKQNTNRLLKTIFVRQGKGNASSQKNKSKVKVQNKMKNMSNNKHVV